MASQGDSGTDHGLIHVYTGDGKGKTTAALGLCFRALGHGFTVHFIQFMKGDSDYGEVRQAASTPGMNLIRFGRNTWVDRNRPDEIDIGLAREGLDHARLLMASMRDWGRNTLMVLDELNVAMDYGLLTPWDVMDLVHAKPPGLELVITGRGAHEEILGLAHYVTEMREIKHPYRLGIPARTGIER